jgi:hypothetical protein
MRREPIDDDPDERTPGHDALRWWIEKDLREQRERAGIPLTRKAEEPERK